MQGVDVYAVLPSSDTEKVRPEPLGDEDLIFFNQPNGKGAALTAEHSLSIDLAGTRPGSSVAVLVSSENPLPSKGIRVAIVEPGRADRLADRNGFLFEPEFASERAATLVRFYPRAGSWKLDINGQGFADGFRALVESYGVVVDDAPAIETPAAPAPTIDMVKKRRQENLEEIESIPDSELRDEVRRAYLDMTKKVDRDGLENHVARVAVMFDVSSSAARHSNNLYGSGEMRKLLIDAAALALEWSPSRKADVFAFGSTGRFLRQMDLKELSTFMQDLDDMCNEGTNYASAFKAFNDYYFGPASPAYAQGESVYGIMVTDGEDNGSRHEAFGYFDRLASERFFMKMIGIGRGSFSLLQTLDDRNKGKTGAGPIDNCDFFAVTSLKGEVKDGKTLQDLLLREYARPEPPSRKPGVFARREKAAEPWLLMASRLGRLDAAPAAREVGPSLA